MSEFSYLGYLAGDFKDFPQVPHLIFHSAIQAFDFVCDRYLAGVQSISQNAD